MRQRSRTAWRSFFSETPRWVDRDFEKALLPPSLQVGEMLLQSGEQEYTSEDYSWAFGPAVAEAGCVRDEAASIQLWCRLVQQLLQLSPALPSSLADPVKRACQKDVGPDRIAQSGPPRPAVELAIYQAWADRRCSRAGTGLTF